MLRELDGKHGPDRVRGVCQSGTQAQRLRAHVQLLADGSGQRLKRRGEREVRDQREHHHRRDRDVAARERPLTHQQPPTTTVESPTNAPTTVRSRETELRRYRTRLSTGPAL